MTQALLATALLSWSQSQFTHWALSVSQIVLVNKQLKVLNSRGTYLCLSWKKEENTEGMLDFMVFFFLVKARGTQNDLFVSFNHVFFLLPFVDFYLIFSHIIHPFCSFPSLYSSQFPISSISCRLYPQGHKLNTTQQGKIRPGTNPHIKAG